MSTFMPNMTSLSDTYGSASHRLICFSPAFAAEWSGVADSSSPAISHILHQWLLCRLCGWPWGASQSFRTPGKAGSARELKHTAATLAPSAFSRATCQSRDTFTQLLRRFPQRLNPVAHCCDYLAKAPWDWLSPLISFTLSSFPLLFLELLPKINLSVQVLGEPGKYQDKRRESESEVAQSCPTLCSPVDWSLPGSSLHGLLQARILEWVAIFFTRGSSQLKDQTRASCIGRQIVYH